jgi:hypothetical protein
VFSEPEDEVPDTVMERLQMIFKKISFEHQNL